MLRSIKEIVGYELEPHDGSIGRCADFLFEDTDWIIRYLVADTRKWLPGRKVLVSPIALREPDWESRRLPVDLSKEQVKNSPPLSEDEPVSRQFEIDYHAYYGWPYYWVGYGTWGPYAVPQNLRLAKQIKEEQQGEPSGDLHLRSANEVIGYQVSAFDRDIGHVDDMIVDDIEWAIRYVVVDTRNWLPGRHVLISPLWFQEIVWSKREVLTDLAADEIENSPEYDPSTPVNREYERRLYDFYGRPVYWE